MITSLMQGVGSSGTGGRIRCGVLLAHTEYGTPRPYARIAQPRTAPHRQLGAALHLLAAAVEAHTPERERWCTCIARDGDSTGDVYLDLFEGTDGEAARGLAHLREIVRRLGWT